MRNRYVLTIIMLAVISLGGLAQKSNNDLHIKRTAFRKPGNLKSAQSLPSQQMDSIVDFTWNEVEMDWNIISRNWFEYDSMGRNTSDTWLGAESDSTFPDYGVSEKYVWDANGMVSEEFTDLWYDPSGFIKDSWMQYEYDGNGNPTTGYSRKWNSMSQAWVPYYTDTSRYVAGNSTEWINYNYDTLAMLWNPLSRTTWEYDSVGDITFRNEFYWNPDSSDWDNGGRTEYFHDQNGRDTARIGYYWDGFSWTKSSKDVTKYNANGAETFVGSYYWDGESEWIGNSKSEYTLDANDFVTEIINSYWDFFYARWYTSDKSTYARDERGNLIEESAHYYDTANSKFIEERRDLYEWDLGVDWSDIAVPLEIAEDTDGDNIITIFSKVLKYTEMIYDTTAMVWDTSTVEYIYYSPFEGGAVQPLVCDADFRTLTGQGPQDIIFINTSTGEASFWYWTFGDGTTSTLKDPVHTYKLPGTYKVSLSTTNKTGECSSTTIKQIKVGNALCSAEFTMAVDTSGQKISLTNLSQGTNLMYHWSFGDGEVSRVMNPSHTYQFAGTYEIILTIQNDAGSCMDRYSLNTRIGTGICKAGFDVFVDSMNNSAKFMARNQNPDNLYRWEFGDGSIAKTRSVEKTFTHPGYYSARLTVANTVAGCVNSSGGTILIGRPGPGGQASFIYVSEDANAVQFNDRSLGEKLSWYWDFNDGNSSKVQNPAHKYALPGYYNVCLTVATADGKRNTYCEKIFAGTETKDQCLAKFKYILSEDQSLISCLDRSLGNPDKWLWTYNGKGATTEQNPEWKSKTPAYVKIRQTIWNSTNGCRDDAFGLVNMGEEGKLKAGFGFIVDTTNKKADTYPVDFIGVSLGDAGKLKWDFGDGTADSTSINPVHVYTEPGAYNVCLTLTNTTTGDVDMSCETVIVGWATSVGGLKGLELGLNSYPNPFRENTTVEFYLVNNSEIDLSIYDLMGRKVRTVARDQRLAGSHTFRLDGSDLAAGNYYLILKTDNTVARTVLSVVK